MGHQKTNEPRNWIGQEDAVPANIASKLQEEAKKNKTFEALCQIFSVRERTRKQLTLRTMLASLRLEGYDVKRADTARCFRFLAALGIGSLVEAANGQVEGLRDIRFSLHAIADTALKGSGGVKVDLKSVDNFTPSQLVGTSRSGTPVDHMANATGPTGDVRRVPATTLAAPTASSMVRHLTNAQPKVSDAPAIVLIKVGKNEMKFEVTLSQAQDLIKMLL